MDRRSTKRTRLLYDEMIAIGITPLVAKEMTKWKTFHGNGALIFQSQVRDSYGRIQLVEETVTRDQSLCGRGVVVQKCYDEDRIAQDFDQIAVGDLVQYYAGTSVNAQVLGLLEAKKERHLIEVEEGKRNESDVIAISEADRQCCQRLQILNLQNFLMLLDEQAEEKEKAISE